MPIQTKSRLGRLLIGLSCLAGSSLMASERPPAGPPIAYRLDEASIRLTRNPGSPSFPVRQLSLSGKGEATLEENGRKQPFHYSPQDFLALLNDLYQLRFFELPGDYTTRYSLSQKADGTVLVGRLRLLDAASTTVCFAVASYEKCVRYAGDEPCELERLSQRLFSEAEQQAGRAPPPR